MASTAAAVPAVGGTTPDISRRTNNPFFDKLFKRVDGLLCVLVSDVEGSLHAKAFNHRYRNPDNNYTLEGDKAHGNETSPPSPHDVEDELFDEDEVFIPDFDSTLPVTYQLASEQANKLPGYGCNESIVSFYQDYVLVQFSTFTSRQQQQQQQHDSMIIGGDNSVNSAHEANILSDDTMFVTLIAKNDCNTQILLDSVPFVRSFVANKFS